MDGTMPKRNDLPTSRRTAIKTGLAVFASGVTACAALTRQAVAQEKIAQAQVQYQLTPKDGAQCDKCVNWQPPNACAIVAGDIKPTGWCVAFAPKQS
jgi:hypothetical protein